MRRFELSVLLTVRQVLVHMACLAIYLHIRDRSVFLGHLSFQAGLVTLLYNKAHVRVWQEAESTR